MPRRVLVCDNDLAIRTLITALLVRGQFDVVTVCGGAEALAALDQDFDAFVLDLMMPDMSGYDVLRHVRDTRPELSKRIVVVTAHAAVAKQPLEEPVAAVLVKPFDIDEFIQVVQRVAEQ